MSAPAIRALDPRGTPPAVELRPLAQRPATLAGLRLGLVNSWPGNDSGLAPLFDAP